MPSREGDIALRAATDDDPGTLWEFLAIAAYEPSLMAALIREARQRGISLCLNVRHDNRARRLYERLGFRLVPGSGAPNRVGGASLGMLWSAPT